MCVPTLTETMSIPTNPIPVHGKVPWRNVIRRVEARKAHPVLGWVYTIHEPVIDGPLTIWNNVSQQELVAEMEKFGRYRVGEQVKISRKHTTKIVARKWNFNTGTFDYHIDGSPDGQTLVMEQSKLAARITAVAQG